MRSCAWASRRDDAVGFGYDFDLDKPVFLVAFGRQVSRCTFWCWEQSLSLRNFP
jgi:hypothetical protein